MAGYDDGRIACDEQGLLIRHYYLAGAKRISYSAIRRVVQTTLRPPGKWRIHGSGDFVRWFSHDRGARARTPRWSYPWTARGASRSSPPATRPASRPS